MNSKKKHTPLVCLEQQGCSLFTKHILLILLPWFLFFFFIFELFFTGFNSSFNKAMLDLTSLSGINAIWGICLIQISVWLTCRIANIKFLLPPIKHKKEFIILFFLCELSFAFLLCLFAGVSAFLIAWSS